MGCAIGGFDVYVRISRFWHSCCGGSARVASSQARGNPHLLEHGVWHGVAYLREHRDGVECPSWGAGDGSMFYDTAPTTTPRRRSCTVQSRFLCWCSPLTAGCCGRRRAQSAYESVALIGLTGLSRWVLYVNGHAPARFNAGWRLGAPERRGCGRGGVFAAFLPVVRRSARFWGCGAAGFSLSCSLSAPCCGRSVPEPFARFSVTPAFTKELIA